MLVGASGKRVRSFRSTFGRANAPSVGGGRALTTGCPNPNAYTVPRTLDPGDLQVDVAADAYGYSTRIATPANGTTPASTHSTDGVTPMLPTFGARYGLLDGLDFGVRLQNFWSLAGDLKIRLLKGKVDLAADPGTEVVYVLTLLGRTSAPQHAGVFYFHAPLLVGLNLSDAVELVASPGVAYAVATNPIPAATSPEQAGASTELLARLGFGADFRLTEHVALHPEVTCMKGFTSTQTLICVAGVGLNLGAQPDRSDLEPPGSPQ
jgi:hypothetical protein